ATKPGAATEPGATKPGAATEPGATKPAVPSPDAEVSDPDGSESTEAGPSASDGDPSDTGSLEDLTPEELARRQKQVRIASARQHYDQGSVLWNQGRYAEAATEYELSYAAVPSAIALYSSALSYERAGKAVEAVRALRRYLELPDCESLPAEERSITCTERRAEAQELLSDQMRLVGELRLDLAEGVLLSEVRVAGRTVPLDDFPLLLRPGPVDVELFGVEPDQRRNRVAYITAGEQFPLYVAPFVTDVSPPLVTDPGPDREAERQRAERRRRILRTSLWVGTGLTAASAVALTVMGSLTLYERRKFAEEKCAPMCTDEQGNPLGTADDPLFPFERQERFETYQLTTNVLIGVTAGLGVATALVGVFAFRKRGPDQSRAPARVGVRGPGLVVRW
ncbi:MAG: hypothetical protein KC501_10305, partial [Myxococcales bacterium]|nr:hypothetical protein [Myxococcales bacterium]